MMHQSIQVSLSLYEGIFKFKYYGFNSTFEENAVTHFIGVKKMYCTLHLHTLINQCQ